MSRLRKQWSTSTDNILYDELKNLSKITRIPVSKLLDESIRDLLKKHDYKKLKDEFKEE